MNRPQRRELPETDPTGAEGCIEVAAVDHFTPDVAAPPPPTIGLAPIDPDRTPHRCSDPGSGCMAMPLPPGGNAGEVDPLPQPGCGFAHPELCYSE